jgi:asparagine synthase (glutamine-hydrolysing)
MCGINLLINPQGNGEKCIQNMMLATAHRGPDYSDWCQMEDNIFLAGNRLKILDLGELANQPVFTENKDAALIWNGALYNYQDLRNELLDQGITFQTRSDSEVLINWLHIFGEQGVDKLKGMYAFAFVDKVKKKVLVARDPIGQKPLYFAQQDGGWAFSSETQGIIASGMFDPLLDHTQFLPYFYSRHSFPDQSFYKDISQLMPGRVLELDFNGNLNVDRQIVLKNNHIEMPSAKDFEELLLDAILTHFHAEVPVGMILSGGADSSLLLKMWHRETGTPLHTFTATFGSKYAARYPDGGFAKSLAEKLHCAHHELLVTPAIVRENWEEYISTLDQPIGDSAGLLTWLIGKEAKKHVKVLISGAGADELFSGYSRHEALRKYLSNPSLVSKLAALGGGSAFLPRRIAKFLNAVSTTADLTYLNFSSLQNIPEENLEQFLKYYPQSDDAYKNALEWDRTYYLVNDILKIQDNAAMAHGLEGRAPYLDHGLVQMSRQLSGDQHLALKPKEWIKELLEQEGLEKLAKRKKIGFGLPLAEWLQYEQDFRDWVFASISEFNDSHGKFFPPEMKFLAEHPERFVKSSFLQIWNLHILSSWVKDRHL